MSYGEPVEMMMPPTASVSTQRAATRYAESSNAV